jgi:hypothetical protein
MKRAIILIIVAMTCITLSAQKQKVKYNPKGQWTFEAPAAPEGYTTGTVEINYTKKKHSATIAFTGNEYKNPIDDVKFAKDSLQLFINIQGSDITFKSKFEQPDKMTGIASAEGGSVPFTLTRDKSKSKSQK